MKYILLIALLFTGGASAGSETFLCIGEGSSIAKIKNIKNF